MLIQTNTPRAPLFSASQGLTVRVIVIAALCLIAHSLMADGVSSDKPIDGQRSPAMAPADLEAGSQPHSLADLSSQRQALLLRLQQLDQDNRRLRQQLSGVSSTGSAQAIEKVLDSHSRTIEQLRQVQLASPQSAPKPIQTSVNPESKQNSSQQGFNVASYQPPASGIDSSAAITDSVTAQSAAAMWALEVAGTSGILALFGALVLLFVVTVLRKSYWMPRKKLATRASAQVSERGLAADLAAGYDAPYKADEAAGLVGDVGKPILDITDPETIRKDQLAMARMLEQGLQLSEDDMALVGGELDAQPTTPQGEAADAKAQLSTERSTRESHTKPSQAGAIAGKLSLSEAISDRQKAERQHQKMSKQTKNPLADQYDQLGGGFSAGFDEEFDELFEEAAKVSEAKPPQSHSKSRPHTSLKSLFGMDDETLVDQCRRSDAEVFRSIREKTCDYVAPAIEEGDYIVEEGCDDLDKYMAIQYIAPPKVELDEAKEQRSLKR